MVVGKGQPLLSPLGPYLLEVHLEFVLYVAQAASSDSCVPLNKGAPRVLLCNHEKPQLRWAGWGLTEVSSCWLVDAGKPQLFREQAVE